MKKSPLQFDPPLTPFWRWGDVVRFVLALVGLFGLVVLILIYAWQPWW